MVVKLLAAVTVVLTFPVLFASFYGMNVALPGAEARGAFWALTVGSLVLSGAVALYFRRRDWL